MLCPGDAVTVVFEDGSEDRCIYWYTSQSKEQKVVVLSLDSNGWHPELVYSHRVKPVEPCVNCSGDLPEWAKEGKANG